MVVVKFDIQKGETSTLTKTVFDNVTKKCLNTDKEFSMKIPEGYSFF